jgi:predicted nuclease of predicted toxin-antitoxin system
MMKFIVDECVGTSVAKWFAESGYNVVSVYDSLQGADDAVVLQTAYAEERILVTSDKDFGDMIFRQQQKHWRVILLRLADERPFNKIKVIRQVLENYSLDLIGNFIVATERIVRITTPKA